MDLHKNYTVNNSEDLILGTTGASEIISKFQ